MPRLAKLPFETGIVERHQGREWLLEGALIEMCQPEDPPQRPTAAVRRRTRCEGAFS